MDFLTSKLNLILITPLIFLSTGGWRDGNNFQTYEKTKFRDTKTYLDIVTKLIFKNLWKPF